MLYYRCIFSNFITPIKGEVDILILMWILLVSGLACCFLVCNISHELVRRF